MRFRHGDGVGGTLHEGQRAVDDLDFLEDAALGVAELQRAAQGEPRADNGRAEGHRFYCSVMVSVPAANWTVFPLATV